MKRNSLRGEKKAKRGEEKGEEIVVAGGGSNREKKRSGNEWEKTRRVTKLE